MSNEVNPTPGTNGGVSDPNAPAASKAGVSPETIDELKSSIADLQKQVRFAVAKLTKGTTPVDTIATDPAEPQPTPRQSAADKEIAARLKVLEDERQAARNERIAAAVESLASKIGINPDWMEDFKGHIERNYKDKITFDDATKSVVFRESQYDDAKSFSQWAEKAAGEGKFNKYKPSKQTGTKVQSGGTAVSASGKQQMTLAEFTRAQREAGRTGKKQNLDVEIID